MNIKVCGITQLKQLQQLEGLDIDFAGLIFVKDSPRYAGDKIAAKDLKSSDLDLKKVGVFVNEEYDEIMKIVEAYSLDIVQLHGNESPDLCEDLSAELEVIKTFHIKPTQKNAVDELLADYDAVCDYYLFDTATDDAFGGTGKQFDWTAISKSKIEKPFFLSGGIGLEDAAKLKAFKHPDFYAVDINSRFEKEPGVKDMGLVLQFKQALKK
ncbi:MAG: phosphoribosylanthranilate isomerase [Ferruginibacter sp.]